METGTSPSSPCGTIRYDASQNLVVLRLKPGVNPRRFAEEQNLNPWNYASDHYAVASFTAYDDIGSARNQFAAPTLSYDFNLQIATALFFLVNLCLGVIGTFWMQTKRRTEESGIMRAFGATRRRVMLMFLAEGWVMATVSMFIACVLYLNYVKLGFGELCISPHQPGTQPDPTWVADKPLRSPTPHGWPISRYTSSSSPPSCTSLYCVPSSSAPPSPP